MDSFDDNNEGLSDDVIVALRNGRKIEAIKLLREATGMDLGDAKQTVDDYLRTQKSSQGSRTAPTMDGGIGRIFWVVVLTGVALALWWFLRDATS